LLPGCSHGIRAGIRGSALTEVTHSSCLSHVSQHD
jgi:hypothetical protein